MTDRLQVAIDIARAGGALGLDYFHRLSSLEIENKGHQDFVSDADKAVEDHIRDLIASTFPEDGIIGEEAAPKPSSSGFTWVIDPIDGTTNFISGIPVWCTVIAIVADDKTQIGVIYDPVHDEMFAARRGTGATLNGEVLICPADTSLTRGSVGAGFSGRTDKEATLKLFRLLFNAGGVFQRNASGALSLAYVSAGRLLGFLEQHMNAWDCLAGQLLIEEAGGSVEDQSASAMLADGGRVVASSTGVFSDLQKIADAAFDA